MKREIWTLDNIEFLASLESDSVQLVYMDPPFGSSRDYKLQLGRRRHGGAELLDAFADSGWKSQILDLQGALGRQIDSAVSFIRVVEDSGNTEIAGYLSMMLPRLIQVHRVLALDGSMYLHCDTSASHYLKIILDLIFGADQFRNEIIWKRTHAHNASRKFGPVHDVILFYSKSNKYIWNQGYTDYEDTYIQKYYRASDDGGRYQLITCTGPGDRTGTRAHFEWRGQFPPPGRHWAWKIERMQELEAQGRLFYSASGVPRLKRYLSDGSGVAVQDVWTDIKRLDANSEERVGYETQKPLALLERIIMASSMPGGLVVDPFSGSGTTAVAAERAGRSWAVSDRSLLAASVTLSRTRPIVGRSSIRLVGFPDNEQSARRLQAAEPQTFGVWGTSMMATRVDRARFDPAVVAGSGEIIASGKKRSFLSWVSTGKPSTDSSQSFKARKLPRVGFVLAEGAGARSIKANLAKEFPALPLIPIDLASLVGQSGRSLGVSPMVSSVLERMQ